VADAVLAGTLIGKDVQIAGTRIEGL
jgi:hypothetical protein